MVDIEELRKIFDQEQRIGVEFPDMRKEVLPHVVRFVRPAPGMSFVLYSDLDEHIVEDAIQEQIGYFSRLNQPFEWKVYGHDRPADLTDRLVAHGFQVEEPEAVMVLDLDDVPAILLEPVTADVRTIEDKDQLVDVIRVLEQVWERDFDWVTERLGGHLAIPDHLSVYVAYVADEPASVGWTYFQKGTQFGSLWGGSTLSTYRKRGLYTAVLAVRVQEARQRGYRYLTVDASPMSQPILARHGFRLLTYAQGCEWQPIDEDSEDKTRDEK